MKKLLAVLLVLVMALGLVACGKNKAGGSDSAEQAAKKFISAYLDSNAEDMVNCVPSFMIDYLCDEFGVDSKKEVIEEMEDNMFDDEEKIDYKILDTEIEEEFTDLEEEDLEDDMEEFGASKSDIKKIDKVCNVIVTAEIEAEDMEEEMEFNVSCIKYDGKWYAIDWD